MAILAEAIIIIVTLSALITVILAVYIYIDNIPRQSNKELKSWQIRLLNARRNLMWTLLFHFQLRRLRRNVNREIKKAHKKSKHY